VTGAQRVLPPAAWTGRFRRAGTHETAAAQARPCWSWISPPPAKDADIPDAAMSDDTRYLQSAAAHFSLMFNESGETARGVDWDSAASQQTQFAQLCRVIAAGAHYSINDIGCGYGALVDVLARAGGDFSYHGFDVSGPLIAAAQARHAGKAHLRFSCSAQVDQAADYSVASGIFHKRFGRSDGEMLDYQLRTLDMLDRTSRLGFSFNSFSRYAAARPQRNDLFYADPCRLFEHCQKSYARHVALLHDYDPLDFTIIVRKIPSPAEAGDPASPAPRAEVGDR